MIKVSVPQQSFRLSGKVIFKLESAKIRTLYTKNVRSNKFTFSSINLCLVCIFDNSGHYEVTKFLIENGADFSSSELQSAAFKGNFQIKNCKTDRNLCIDITETNIYPFRLPTNS